MATMLLSALRNPLIGNEGKGAFGCRGKHQPKGKEYKPRIADRPASFDNLSLNFSYKEVNLEY